jgi:hypothetical protein
MDRAYNVFDSDGHILEPLNPWKKVSTQTRNGVMAGGPMG